MLKSTIPVFLIYLNKLLYVKQGTFKLMGLISAAPTSYGLYKYITVVFAGADLKKIYITLLVEAVMFLIFAAFSTIDMFIGIQASLHENAVLAEPLPANQVIKSNKLWSTFWKFFGITVLTILISFVAIISIALEAGIITWVMIWALIGFWFMACAYEFYSVGENIARRNNGVKPRVFQFFDKVLDALQQKAIDKINDKL